MRVLYIRCKSQIVLEDGGVSLACTGHRVKCQEKLVKYFTICTCEIFCDLDTRPPCASIFYNPHLSYLKSTPPRPSLWGVQGGLQKALPFPSIVSFSSPSTVSERTEPNRRSILSDRSIKPTNRWRDVDSAEHEITCCSKQERRLSISVHFVWLRGYRSSPCKLEGIVKNFTMWYHLLILEAIISQYNVIHHYSMNKRGVTAWQSPIWTTLYS